MGIQQVLQFLIDEGYLLAGTKGYSAADKFIDAIRGLEVSDGRKEHAILTSFPLPITKLPPFPIVANGKPDWAQMFIEFIQHAKVPAKLEDSRLNLYPANKYSEAGMKAFRKAIESGVDYGTLVKSTMLYYKSNIRLKKAIGNYFAEGHWRSDYLALVEAAELGTTELEQHLKSETKTNEHNPYRLG